MANRSARSASSSPRIVQPHIPGLSRSDRQARPPKLSESALQSQALRSLAGLGYAALEAGRARKKVTCPNPTCGHTFYPEGWQGNTIGFPDVAFFRYSNGYPGIGIFVEMKGETTVVRPAQQQLADAKRSVIAYSIEDAVRAVLSAEEAMDAYRLSAAHKERLLTFLEINKGRI